MNNGLGVDISQRSIQLSHSILTVKMILHPLRHTADFLSATTSRVGHEPDDLVASCMLGCMKLGGDVYPVTSW